MPVNGDAAVVRFTEWHSEQPTLTNRFDPLLVDCVGGAGGAGADRRMKSAKFATSDDISETVPIVVPKLGLLFLPFRILLVSSGVALKTQPAVALRSFCNTSLVTPCLTLYASPANISNDLFWALHPKRVMEPSLPEVLKLPPIPYWFLVFCVEERLDCRAASGVFSTSPRPNRGVGMRKITLP